MIVELYPFLAEIEHDLDSPWARESNPLWGKGKQARDAQINATISKFDVKLQTSSVDDLAAYAEGLKPHLKRAVEYRLEDSRTDYQRTIAECHKNLSFAFFALIVRAFDRKRIPFNVREYAVNAGITDFTTLSSEVCQAADGWGIFHTPSIEHLLTSPRGKNKKISQDYDLLAAYPDAEVYLKRLVPNYLKEDYSLQNSTKLADASIIAYVIASELNINNHWQFFERFWHIQERSNGFSQEQGIDTHLRSAFKGAKSRINKAATKEVLQLLLRKEVPGISEDTMDTDKFNHYIGLL